MSKQNLKGPNVEVRMSDGQWYRGKVIDVDWEDVNGWFETYELRYKVFVPEWQNVPYRWITDDYIRNVSNISNDIERLTK